MFLLHLCHLHHQMTAALLHPLPQLVEVSYQLLLPRACAATAATYGLAGHDAGVGGEVQADAAAAAARVS